MKKQLPKRFYIFMMMMCSFTASNAQIIYTNVIPDSNMMAVYNLDLNNDGVTDFHMTKGWFGMCPSFKALIVSNDSNSIYGYDTTITNKLILNDSIDSYAMWIKTGWLKGLGNVGPGCNTPTNIGIWNDSSDGYAGLKLKVLTQTYYGWVRLSIFPSSFYGFCRIKDYAYNSIPGQPILAGDTGNISTGIIHKNFGTAFLEIYPNPVTNSVTIKFSSAEAGEIQITNLFGQIVFSEKVNTEQKQIDVSRFTAGIYVIRWNSGENFETKTFSVIK